MTTAKDLFRLASHHGFLQPMQAMHAHSEIELNLVAEGSLTYLFGSTQIEVQADTIAIFWGAIPHREIGWRADTRFMWLTLPLERVLSWELPLSDQLLQGQVLTTHTRLPLDTALFDQWDTNLNAPDAVSLHPIIWLEVEAWFRRLEQRLTIAPWAAEHKPDDKASAMARFIIRHYAEAITVGQIAQAVHLHPNYATTLFRHTYGTGLLAYLTRYRVAQAQRLLLMSEQSVADIGFACGFQSVSRFYEAFEAACGQSPGKYRARLRG